MDGSSINHMTHLVGRAGKDIEPAVGKGPAKFTLAVEAGYDTAKKETLTDWYDVAVWEPLATSLLGQITRGMRLFVSGKASVWAAESGDRKQINARSVGVAIPFLSDGPTRYAATVPADVAPAEPEMEGVTEGEW